MNGFRYAQIVSRVLNCPLWAHPTKALIFYNALAPRFGTSPVDLIADSQDLARVSALRGDRSESTGKPKVEASRFEGIWPVSEDAKRIEPFRLTTGGVGIITITGSLINRGAWVGSYSGETSYEGIKFQLDRARRDSRVKSVILDIETPGGEATGASETAAMVRALAGVKPVFALANGMMASAGYNIASGATRIINTPSGLVGSIGVVMLHLDYSRAIDEKGITPTLIFAGKHKVDGNPLEPLSDDVKSTLQGEVNQSYDLFVDTVVAGRGARTSAKAVRATEAETFTGKDAVAAKLADDVGTFEELLADVTRKSARSTAAPRATGTRSAKTMNDHTDELTHTEAQVNHARTEAHKAGVTEGTAAGAKAERDRLLAVMVLPQAKGRLEFAMKLALEAPTLSAEQVGNMCESVPKVDAAAPSKPPLSERNESETGANNITSLPGNQQRENEPANSWDSAVDSVNKRTASKVQNPRLLRN